MLDRVIVKFTFTVTNDELDKDYSSSCRTRSQNKTKQRSSRVLSTSSVRSTKRVRLCDILLGAIHRSLTLYDSSRDDNVPPTISASSVLERYSCLFLLVLKVFSVMGCGSIFNAPFLCTSFFTVVVADLETGLGGLFCCRE